MVRKILMLAFFGVTINVMAQQYGEPAYEQRQVRMPTEHLEQANDTPRHRQYTKYRSGFWCSIEALGGYSVNVSDRMSNTALAELDLYAGYRFNEYVRVGMGLGGRYYFTPGNLRRNKSNWALPIMLNVRGAFIPQDYRTVVPYYSFDIGASVTDGFMMRPTIGIRCGEPRSAFLLGVSYMLQSMRGTKFDQELGRDVNATHPTSFFALRVGYEF